MLDSADLKQALKVTNRYDNRYERAADAVAALVGKSVVLNASLMLFQNCRIFLRKQKNLSAANKFWLICTALLNKAMPAF